MKFFNSILLSSLLSASVYGNSFFENDLEKEIQRIHSIFDTMVQHPRFISTKNSFFSHTSANVNIYEKNKYFYIEYQLPGLKKEDIQLKLHEDKVLSLKVEQKNKKEEKAKEYHTKEISYNYISRSIKLPDYVDAQKLDVSYKNGILYAKMPIIKPKIQKAKIINIK